MEVQHSIYAVSRKLKKVEQSLYNALRSIYADATFVGEIRGLRPHFPLLANLRCGLWYASCFDQVCYFKSTDGHNGNWAFSPTRLNMHVALLSAHKGGCMIVDATRKGKRFPDSMSKTIPIWTCVFNRAIARIRGTTSSNLWDTSLHLPSWISHVEKARIENHLDGWVDLLLSMNTDLEQLSSVLMKPLRPLWISQESLIWINDVPDTSCLDFTPVILISASKTVTSSLRISDEDFSWNYIPGAADDEESWARGLTPGLFWKHAYDIVSSGPNECNQKVAGLVERDRVYRNLRGGGGDGCTMQDRVDLEVDGKLYHVGTTGLIIGSALDNDDETMARSCDSVIDCYGSLARVFDTGSYLRLQIEDSKHDRFSLQRNLPAALDFAKKQLQRGSRLLVCCEKGEDVSVSVCLAILICCHDRNGKFDAGESYRSLKDAITKGNVRQSLVYICSYVATARPSRGMLKQVYNFVAARREMS